MKYALIVFAFIAVAVSAIVYTNMPNDNDYDASNDYDVGFDYDAVIDYVTVIDNDCVREIINNMTSHERKELEEYDNKWDGAMSGDDISNIDTMLMNTSEHVAFNKFFDYYYAYPALAGCRGVK
ncbi:MAG: hypothetical protein EB828_04510 [Nitrosopumilus sp. D6]|nr:MAG: hypothetical protein EB828_04510 [Nitrosopumilus sp. D6]